MGVHATQPFPFAKTVYSAYPGAIAFVLIMVWQAAGFMVAVEQVTTVYNIRMDALATTGLHMMMHLHHIHAQVICLSA